MIASEQLKKIAPIKQVYIDKYLPYINAGFEKYGFDSVERQACFLAQILHESGCFRYSEEIASGKAYEGRKDLGNTCAGDGVKFKGRGLIQITGRANTEKLSLFLFGDNRLLENPKPISDNPELAVNSAFWFWQKNKLNDICDKPDDWRNGKYNKFQWLTKRINGGQNGISERTEFYNKAKAVL